MKINVTSKVDNLNVTVVESNNCVEIFIEEKDERKESKTLGSVALGEIVSIGERKYIVLGHGAETTALLDANSIDNRVFDYHDGDYKTSDIRKYINDKYYKELCESVGKDNIIKHKVSLKADDGTNKGAFCKDFVSLITAENYRRYREYIPTLDKWWWTATGVNADMEDYARLVCCVDSGGVLSWSNSDRGGVRPFCILNSSVLVS